MNYRRGFGRHDLRNQRRQLYLPRDVADPLFLLESGDELPGDGHLMTIGVSAPNIILASGDRPDGAEPKRLLLIRRRSSCRC